MTIADQIKADLRKWIETENVRERRLMPSVTGLGPGTCEEGTATTPAVPQAGSGTASAPTRTRLGTFWWWAKRTHWPTREVYEC